MMKTSPAVFAVGTCYQIMVPVEKRSLMWVKVGGNCYYDESNGIMRSLSTIHRMEVPKEELEKAGRYTVCERVVIDRKPYYPVMEDIVETEFVFRPVKNGTNRAFFISDAHNDPELTVRAAKAFGDIDFLILGGDIPNHCGRVENLEVIYRIASDVTNGEIPVVFARGNHDLRGLYAESFSDYIPNRYGNTYYTFRLGDIWGIVLDCGEDKRDTNEEYGGTVCCHSFRQREKKFIESVIADRKNEYAADGVRHRAVVSHVPFTKVFEHPFDIEQELYGEWTKLIGENIKPEIMLCGHTHEFDIWEKGGENDDLGQPCTVVTCAEKHEDCFAGAGMVISRDKIEIYKAYHNGNCEKMYEQKLKGV